MSTHDVPNPQPHAPGHEGRDVSPRAIFMAGAGMVVAGIAIYMGLWLLFGYLVGEHTQMQPEISPVAGRLPPPDPRLQGSPPHPAFGPTDVAEMHKREDAVLESYSFDPQTGVVRIPINVAMRTLATQGLPGTTRPAGGGGQ